MAAETSSSSEALTANSFAFAGYAFTGWNTSANSMGTAYASDATYPFTASVTLYAQWTPLPSYLVTFNVNGGTGTMAPESWNKPEPLDYNEFSNSGYTFSGWNTSADGSGTAYANEAIYPFTASVTLYAQWTPLPSYTVTFRANGGTGSMAAETSNVAEPLTTNAFANSSDTFVDWNTRADGSSTTYFNGATYPFTASVTLYAQWTTVDSPTIILQPTNQVVQMSGVGTFSAEASGTPTPTVQWDVSTNGGSTWSPIAGATSPTYSLGTGDNNGFEYEAVFTNEFGSATTTSAQLIDLAQSGNWSGYVETYADYTHVSGQWTVPTLTCNSPNDLQASQWVGIDGLDIGDPYVEQVGTETDCVGMTPVYSAWYEMFGNANVNGGFSTELDPSTYPVAAGDVMTGSVSFAIGAWTLTVVDTTASWAFSTTIANPSPPPLRDSAEWIVEDPVVCTNTCAEGSLADFGSVTFTNASATSLGVTDSIIFVSSYGLQTVDGSTPSVVMMSPGVLSNDGTSFTVTWQSSS